MKLEIDIFEEGKSLSKEDIRKFSEILFKNKDKEHQWVTSSKLLKKENDEFIKLYFVPNQGQEKEVGYIIKKSNEE